jgi:hypothetical protein
MAKGPLPLILLGLLCVSALVTAILTFAYLQGVTQLRRTQPEMARVNQEQAIMRGILTETVEYSKTHPEMQALIDALNSKPAPSATTPATRPTP